MIGDLMTPRGYGRLGIQKLLFNIRRVLVKFGYLETACPKCHPNTTD